MTSVRICQFCGQAMEYKAKLGISKRQQQALEAIAGYIEEHGTAPSYTEIAEMIGCNKSGAHDIVMRLVARGRIRIQPGHARSMAIVEEGHHG